MLGIIPPEPLGESPPFPISRLTKSRPLLWGMENWAGGIVNVAPAIIDQNQVPAIGMPTNWSFIVGHRRLGVSINSSWSLHTSGHVIRQGVYATKHL